MSIRSTYCNSTTASVASLAEGVGWLGQQVSLVWLDKPWPSHPHTTDVAIPTLAGLYVSRTDLAVEGVRGFKRLRPGCRIYYRSDRTRNERSRLAGHRHDRRFGGSSNWGKSGPVGLTSQLEISPLILWPTISCDLEFSPVGKLGPGRGQKSKSGRDGR